MNQIQQRSILVFGISCLVLVSYSFNSSLHGSDWPEFRGPHGNGQAGQAQLPLSWSETENVKWKSPIHGRGWSSPVIWGDQIWLTTATDDGKKMYAVCVNVNDGSIERDLLLFENETPRFRHATNSYASPTPVVEEGRVYVHFGSYGTAAIDTNTGKTIWSRRDLECNHWRGPGSSPIIVGNRIFVAYDGYDVQYVVCLDKNTGKTLWKKDRNIDYGTDNGDLKKAYCTCIFVDDGKRQQIVSPSAMETISYDLQTGDELWRVRHGGMNAAARPVYGDGIVYIVIGDAGPTLCAVKTNGSGTVTDTHIVWMMKSGGPKRPSMILKDRNLYMVSDDGIAQCVEAKTGKTIWKKRLGGKFRSSPILASDRIYFFDLDGKSFVINATTDFELLSTNELDHGCQASCAVVGNAMIIRTTENLYRVEQ